MKKLSNVEFTLLLTIFEYKQISGYRLNKIILDRGFREWIDIGTTSIYVGLEKLQQKGFLVFEYDSKKTGKGPLPKIFKITNNGTSILKETTINFLSSTRERDASFDLGIAALSVIKNTEAILALSNRKEFLSESYNNLKDRFTKLGGETLEFHSKVFFQHSLYLIKCELNFLNSLVEKLHKR
ncbi:MAG: hypothetical protein A2Y40_00700 [Candidatus Margulisbacteria bacterium GWF2_35_9]|nr:MAG: hypothetical protein A2Y40_00700 [Candidatus Margulisbacteria bacterium GWF2_35_9]